MKKLIGVAVAVAVVGGTALATGSVGGGDDGGPRPDYATVTVDMSEAGEVIARQKGLAGGGGGSAKKPKLVYLQSSTPVPINPADPAAGGVGPFIDIELTGCKKVIDGGVVPSRFDVYSQGTYVENPATYHALIAIDAQNLGDRTAFTVTSNLTCLKGVK